MEVTIAHDLEGQEFTATLANDQAELSYAKPEEKVIDFQHTFVPECFRGKGVANKLIQAAVAAALFAVATGQLPKFIQTVRVAQYQLLKDSQASKWPKAMLLPVKK